jgi:hypothetical protein
MTQAHFPVGASESSTSSGPTALIRQAIQAQPGITRAALVQQLVALGVNADSVSSLLSQLAKRKVVRSESRADASGREVAHYWLVEALVDEQRLALQRERAAKAREALAAKRAAIKAGELPAPPKKPRTDKAPAPVAQATEVDTPAPPPAAQEPAAEADSRKRRRIQWEQAEIEALCRKWAADHVQLATKLSDKALLHLARMDHCGYRPREMQADVRRKFMAQYLTVVEKFVRELREPRAVAPAPEAAKPAAAPVVSEPAAAAPAAGGAALTLGALIDQALERTVKQALEAAVLNERAAIRDTVDKAVERALIVQEHHLLTALADMLKGIPGYNRPIVIKRAEPAPEEAKADKPLYQVIIVGGFSAQLDSVRRAFPQLDVRQSTHTLPDENDPDLVVGLAKWMSHPLEKAVKRKYGQRFFVIHGAADMLKQTIARKLNVSLSH